MVSRYIRSSRSSSGGRSTSALQDQFIRELTQEAQKVLKDLSGQFSRDLESQSSNFLQNLYGQGANGDGQSGFGSANVASLFANASRLFARTPKARVTTSESARSREVESRFKLAQAQSLAEAGVLLNKGEKNL